MKRLIANLIYWGVLLTCCVIVGGILSVVAKEVAQEVIRSESLGYVVRGVGMAIATLVGFFALGFVMMWADLNRKKPFEPRDYCGAVKSDPARKDWPEDLLGENGNYQCKCISCDCQFTGHKRRVVCWQCAHSKPTAPAV